MFINIIKIGDTTDPIRRKWHGLVARSKKQNREYCAFKDFKSWFLNQKKECFYCKKKDVKLTIDRKNNNLGYVTGNMALACSSCNSAKGDRYTEEEMLEYCRRWRGRIIHTHTILSG